MKAIIKSSLFLALGIILINTSCSKDGDVGPIGPEGPQGEQGIQGEQGPQGDQGPAGESGQDGIDGEDGKDGNAEVYYSDWIPANFSGASTSVKFMGIDFPSTLPSAASIRDTHIILVYFSGFGDGNTYQLPVLNFRGAQFTNGYGSGSSAAADINIRAEALSGDLTEFQIDPARGSKFRYVIIPPNINISGKMKNVNDFKKMTYYEVMDYLGIEY
ncbi:collagen-like protein [Cytophaga sp. FL35]|uniref:collagen-like protein n=1 Tax=Cytophaga sp. FL35 TaxID=1904456 RepID=UPI001653BDFD|nr:collagen-like protein [Cytophaga sp. FL35]MBC6999481.1 collagen-like protein [Cytophaga sp. FL35]